MITVEYSKKMCRCTKCGEKILPKTITVVELRHLYRNTFCQKCGYAKVSEMNLIYQEAVKKIDRALIALSSEGRRKPFSEPEKIRRYRKVKKRKKTNGYHHFKKLHKVSGESQFK